MGGIRILTHKENDKEYITDNNENIRMTIEKPLDIKLVLYNKWNLKHHYLNWKQMRQVNKAIKENDLSLKDFQRLSFLKKFYRGLKP